MNKTVRLAALAVLALALTSLCLARSPGFTYRHRISHSNCVPRCGRVCTALGLLTYQTCSSCYCYLPTPAVGGCGGGCYYGGGCYGGGCYGGGCYGGGCYGGCYGGGGCDGGGCGGGCG